MHRVVAPALRRCALALALGLLALGAGPAFGARSNWHQLTVGHFHIYSTFSDAKTREVARQIQAFEQTVGLVLKTEEPLPDVPTYIYLLDSEDYQRNLAPHPGTGGFFAAALGANRIVIDGVQDFGWVKYAVFHEYTHYIQRSTHNGILPLWYLEGYAELFGSFRLVGDSVVLGEPPASLQEATQDWIPIDRLLEVKSKDSEYHDQKTMPQFYGESWALVHLLLFDDEKLRAPTERYLTSLSVGAPEDAAFKHAFRFDKTTLDTMVRKTLRQNAIAIRKLKFKTPPEIGTAPVTRVPAAEADLEIARLAFAVGRPRSVVDPMIAAAVAESSDDLPARALAARISAFQGGPVDIAALAAWAKSPEATPSVRIDIAGALMSKNRTSEAAKAALEILDAVVEGDSPPIEAPLLWGRAAELQPVPAAKVVAVLEPAARRVPRNTEVLKQLAVACEQLGNRAKARDYYNRIILVSEFAPERLWAQKQADSERLQDDSPGLASRAAAPARR